MSNNCNFPKPSPFKSFLNEFCIFENNDETNVLKVVIIGTYIIFIFLNLYLLHKSRKKAKRMTQVNIFNPGTFGET